MLELILAIDIGTSSIRCSAYQIHHPSPPSSSASEDDDDDDTTITTSSTYPCIQYLPGSLSAKPISMIEPNSGKIYLFPRQQTYDKEHIQNPSIFDWIDKCMAETIQFLRQYTSSSFHIRGIGFSSFVMNLIGVDQWGLILHPHATFSYACNTVQVQQECQQIQR